MDRPPQISIRGVYWLAFFALILASWWHLYSISLSMNMDIFGRGMSMEGSISEMVPITTMDMQQQMNFSTTLHNMTSDGSHEKLSDSGTIQSMPAVANGAGVDMSMPLVRFQPLFGMWAVMMAAMMLPTMMPSLKSYEDLMISANGTWGGWLGLLLGYSIVWVVFAAVISGVQLLLLSLKLIDIMGLVKSFWVSSALLIVAGLYQFTRAKEICHGVCHSPMMYFIGHWRNGFGGGILMGLGLGVFCVGCCWLFMVLGFAGGVMNFLWMGLATLFMVVEKLPEIGHRVSRPMGISLIIAGLGCAAWTYQVQGVN